jgi:hypothetical protein
MTAQSHPSHEPESRLHTLVNWLALAALLALGIFAAPARADTRAPRGCPDAHGNRRCEPVAALRVRLCTPAALTGYGGVRRRSDP